MFFIGIGSIVKEEKNPSNSRWSAVTLSIYSVALDDRDSMICIFRPNPFIKQGDMLLAIPMVHRTKYIMWRLLKVVSGA